MFLLLYFFFIGVKNNIVNYKEYSDQMNNGIEYLMRHIYVLITVCYISYSMEYKYFTLVKYYSSLWNRSICDDGEK